MSKKTYLDKNCDLNQLLKDIETWFLDQGYQTQNHVSNDNWYLQAAKTETWRKIVGASRAFNVVISGEDNNFSIELGTGEWTSNLVAGGVAAFLTGGSTLIISGITAGWSKKIETDLWNFIDQKVIFGEKSKSIYAVAFSKTQDTAESKLKKLKEAHDQGLIDKIAYDSKRLEIENSIQSAKQTSQVEEQIDKLKELLEAGILTPSEFETKRAKLMPNSINSELEAKLSKLKAAFSAGIFSQEEYNYKKAEIEKQFEISSKIKKLEEAKQAGIITAEEFEKKKQILENTY